MQSPVDSDSSSLPSVSRPSVNAFSTRFGAFEVSLDTGELRKHGVRVRLQRLPFHILQALLEKPGQVVSREELRSRLWSSDTFVDFESGLNTAINRLRTALGDSAESPIYIETLARIGYRFVAPVVAPPPSPSLAEPADSFTASAAEGKINPRKRARWWAAGALFAAAALAATFFLHRGPREPASFRQLTFSNGLVRHARFAHDGKHVVYSAALNGKSSRVFETSTDGVGTQRPRLRSGAVGKLVIE